VLTAIGLVIQLDLVHPSPTADHTALRWHAYLWDPWFLVWGLLLATALARSRSQPRAVTPRVRLARARAIRGSARRIRGAGAG
jgi:hypothetical protein